VIKRANAEKKTTSLSIVHDVTVTWSRREAPTRRDDGHAAATSPEIGEDREKERRVCVGSAHR